MKKLIRRIYFFTCVLIFSLPQSFTYALQVNGYDPSYNDRFVSGTYGTSNPVANSGFVGASYDWSGVGWQSDLASRSVALVSPQHFICANHYKIPEGGNVTFYNRDGQLKSYTVQGYSTFTSTDSYGTHTADLALGWLSAPVQQSDKVSYYPVLGADDPDLYYGQDAFLYGWNARAGVTSIDGISLVATSASYADLTVCWKYDYHTGPGYEGEAGGESGDSGSPSFLAWNGELTVLGPHFAISTPPQNGWSTFDGSIQWYTDDINTAMAPSGYQLEIISPVPEPATVLLLGAGLAGLAATNKKTRR